MIKREKIKFRKSLLLMVLINDSFVWARAVTMDHYVKTPTAVSGPLPLGKYNIQGLWLKVWMEGRGLGFSSDYSSKNISAKTCFSCCRNKKLRSQLFKRGVSLENDIVSKQISRIQKN